jgi:hypothetical protein
MPDKNARCNERSSGPQGERSESSRKIDKLDPGLRRGDDLFDPLISVSLVLNSEFTAGKLLVQSCRCTLKGINAVPGAIAARRPLLHEDFAMVGINELESCLSRYVGLHVVQHNLRV